MNCFGGSDLDFEKSNTLKLDRYNEEVEEKSDYYEQVDVYNCNPEC